MQADHINVRHLACLVAVVQRGSVSAASRSVNISQPAVTQGIAKLERDIGLPLFDRSAKGMAPLPHTPGFALRAEIALRLIGSARVTSAQIRAFVALYKTGSYAAAAAATGLAQPSLHRAVGDLSLTLGYRLVERKGRGLAFTARGDALAGKLQLAIAELRSGLAELSPLAAPGTLRITIGAMPLSRASLVPEAIARFHAANPAIAIAVIEGSFAELAHPLRVGEVDFMVGALRGSTLAPDLAQEALLEDWPVVIARAGHPLARDAALDAAALTRFPWIVPGKGTPLRALWEGVFASAGLAPPAIPIECGSVITARQLLLRGDYLTPLSPDQVAVELEAGWLVQLGRLPGEPSRIIGITTRVDWRPTPLQQMFLQALRDVAHDKPNSVVDS